MSIRLARSAVLVLIWTSSIGGAATPKLREIAAIDLSGPFVTRSAWRFTAVQGPEFDDSLREGGKAPGAVALCISNDGGRSCSPDLQRILRPSEGEDLFSQPHFLGKAQVVTPRGGRALLLVQLASLHSANGNQRVATQILAYDRSRDRFRSIYGNLTGRNNNEDVRFVTDGPLEGAVISAEPTGNAPFGYWITVNRLTRAYTYKQVIRFRSATRYADGNPLSVNDSEMPNIQHRLGLWRPGTAMPVPKKNCPKPHLVRMELWCS
ncbi:MAG: hypothetical protein WC729_06960 [Sphingomonas sp.]|jgi:hypothetical protein|uniref:hypothetical protein n=1 Tax=Sphingomonas sp. TaxID=28214 RepID=UPI003566F98B